MWFTKPESFLNSQKTVTVAVYLRLTDNIKHTSLTAKK